MSAASNNPAMHCHTDIDAWIVLHACCRHAQRASTWPHACEADFPQAVETFRCIFCAVFRPFSCNIMHGRTHMTNLRQSASDNGSQCLRAIDAEKAKNFPMRDK